MTILAQRIQVAGAATFIDGLMTNVQFVSPMGDNANSGLTGFSPKKSIVAAYNALPVGGTIYIAEGSVVDDAATPAYTGIWVTEKALPPGWLPAKPVRFIGYGTSSHNQFGAPCVNVAAGSSTDHMKPAVWIAGVNNNPLYFENIFFNQGAGEAYNSAPQCSIRLGWDYRRSGTALSALLVTQAQRTNGITTLTFGAAHGMNDGNTFFLSSTDGNFRTTTYTITSHTSTTVTYSDLGETNASYGPVSNSGTVYPEDRGPTNGVSNISFKNMCLTPKNMGTVDGGGGPTVDIGFAFWVWFADCSINAYAFAHQNSLDRTAAIFMKGDGWQNTGPNATFRNIIANGGGIRYYGGATGGATAEWALLVDEFLQENAYGPAVELIDTSTFGVGIIKFVHNADQLAAPLGLVKIDPRTPPSAVSIEQVYGMVVGPCTFLSGSPPNMWAGSSQPSPWIPASNGGYGPGQLGFWADGRIAGKHPGVQRNASPVSARYRNWINDSSTWTQFWTNVSKAAIDAPDGSNSAVRITATAAATPWIFEMNQDVGGGAMNLQNGDTFFLGMWLRGNCGAGLSLLNNAVGFSSPYSQANATIVLGAPYIGDGEWQWIYGTVSVSGVSSSNASLRLALNVDATHTFDIWNPVLFRVPVGTMTANEFAEVAGTLRPWPYYMRPDLYPGALGTLAGQMLLVDGGVLGPNPAKITSADYSTVVATTAASFYTLGVNLLATSSATVVIPASIGKKFMPQSVAIRIKTLTGTLTGSPKVRVGNSASHDNIAPLYTIGLAAVLDNVFLLPLANPLNIVDLGTNSVIVEVQTAGIATPPPPTPVMTADVYVTGIYV